jgi:hypothetical protein
MAPPWEFRECLQRGEGPGFVVRNLLDGKGDPYWSDLTVIAEVLEHIRFNPLPGLTNLLSRSTDYLYVGVPIGGDAQGCPPPSSWRDLPDWDGVNEGDGPHVMGYDLDGLLDLVDALDFEPVMGDVVPTVAGPGSRVCVIGRRKGASA